MSWNLCQYPDCEAYTARPDGELCESHRRAKVKQEQDDKKAAEKRKAKKGISKNPKDWNNTFLCSDGTRVTQAQIDQKYSGHRAKLRHRTICQGCGKEPAVCNAHIIAKARCKKIGKTELIWNSDNMFQSCFKCNAAIETPKGHEWKRLKNIDTCIQFIYEHDKELYFKFEAQGWRATTEPHRIG